MALCCEECLSDEFIKDVIRANSKNIGVCEFCKSENVYLVSPDFFTDHLQQVIDIYDESAEGEFLLRDLLKRDWNLFKKLNEISTDNFLDCVFYPDQYSTKRFDIKDSNVKTWEEFKEELKHDNRFFVKSFPEKEDLRNTIELLEIKIESSSEYFYRARVNIDVSQYPCNEMGRPPKEKARGGRANPIGIAYLYVASDPSTAIAELRPHKGEITTVAKIKITKDLKLVDLRFPRTKISPFALKEEQLENLRFTVQYLCKLGDELSKPISPRKADLDYLPSQKLCEFIKHLGFDGVIYKSSLGIGNNYALFHESGTEIIETTVAEVKDIGVQHTEVSFAN